MTDSLITLKLTHSVIFTVTMLLVNYSVADPIDDSTAKTIVLDDESDLLGARFTLQHVKGTLTSDVSLAHTFYTGDKFRFVIRPNKSAYLYVVNINAKGAVSLVWPPAKKLNKYNNRVDANQSTTIPPRPAKFKFSGEPGSDWLLVVLSPAKEFTHFNSFIDDMDMYRQHPGEAVEYRNPAKNLKHVFKAGKVKDDKIDKTGVQEQTKNSTPGNSGSKVPGETKVEVSMAEKLPMFSAKSAGQMALTVKPDLNDIGTYGAQSSEGNVTLVFPYLLNHKARRPN